MAKLVSILIPCYNAERWIQQALRSTLAQTWPNVEVIVVDDGSSDRSFAVAQSFEAANVKILRQVNRGASAARNRAYAECQGEWIQHLDADDFLSPDKIGAQMDAVSECGNDALAVCATVHFTDGTDPESGFLDNGWPAVDCDDPVEWLIDLYGPERGSMVQPGAWLTPRAIAESIGPWNESIDPSPDNDGEYFCRAVLRAKCIRRAPTGRVYYRKFPNGGSMSSRRSAEYQLGGLRSLELTMQHLLAVNQSPRARQALGRRFKEFAYAAYPYSPAASRRALARAAELGFGDFEPHFATKRGNVVASLFGWKLARRASVWKQRLSDALRR